MNIYDKRSIILNKKVASPAFELYQTIIKQSRRPEFYNILGVPDTLNGRFEVLALHVFFVMYRLGQDPSLLDTARALSEEVVKDIDRNLREIGVGDLSVGRKVKELTEGLYGRFGAYKDGVEGDDNCLYEALRRNVYSEIAVEEEKIKSLTNYIRQKVEVLATLNVSKFEKGIIDFGEVLSSVGE